MGAGGSRFESGVPDKMGIKEAIKSIIHEFGSDRAVLNRLPYDLRDRVLDSEPENIIDTLQEINQELVNRGSNPLNYREFEEAIEGNLFVHKRD